jgi:hypothetical protein
MDICILRLSTVVSTRIDNEAVVRMDVPWALLVPSRPHIYLDALDLPRLVCSMIATSQAPCSVSSLPSPSSVPELVRVRLWPGWKGKVHQVRNALLPAATVWILHTGHLSLCILIHQSVGSLALGLVLWFCSLDVARSGVASRRVGAYAAVRVCEKCLGGGDRWSCR